MTYFLLAFFFTAVLLLYIRIAGYFNITDEPTKRGSHSGIIIRGGGIIFPLSILSFYFINGFYQPYFLTGLLGISLISFLDDIFSLKNSLRIVIQFFCAYLLLIELSFDPVLGFFVLLLLVFICGWINAFNFMDGINGITAMYGLVSIGSLYYVNTIVNYISSEFLITLFIAVCIFTYFNARRRAVLFAGDVGSVSLSYILAYLMISLIIESGRYEYILFFSVYGIDSIMTIVIRLVNNENIFEPHRSHLYQILANDTKLSQVTVSFSYAFLQFLVNILVLIFIKIMWLSSLVLISAVLGLLIVLYFSIKKTTSNYLLNR